jgi:hypothetical protein
LDRYTVERHRKICSGKLIQVDIVVLLILTLYFIVVVVPKQTSTSSTEPAAPKQIFGYERSTKPAPKAAITLRSAAE